MSSDTKYRDSGKYVGMIWFIGWLFTIGFAGLPFWRSVFGIIIWPYFLGVAFK